MADSLGKQGGWRRAHVAVGALGVLVCSCDPGTPSAGDEQMGAVFRGELRSYVATFENGRTGNRYFLRVEGSDGLERPLLVSGNLDLPPDTRVDVWGVAEGDSIRSPTSRSRTSHSRAPRPCSALWGAPIGTVRGGSPTCWWTWAMV